MPDSLTPVRRIRRRRVVLGHTCPRCRELWAVGAVRAESGFFVSCRYCDYQRPVAFSRQAGRDS